MRIKDCRYRVVCSRSEELLRFTNLTTVLRPSPTHPTNRRFRSSSFLSLVFFLLGSISFFPSFFFFIFEKIASHSTFTIIFPLIHSVRCAKSIIFLFLLDDRKKYTVFPSG